MAKVGIRAYARHRGVSQKAVQQAMETGRISFDVDQSGAKLIDPERADHEWDLNTDIAKKPVRTRAAGEPPPIAPEDLTHEDLESFAAEDRPDVEEPEEGDPELQENPLSVLRKFNLSRATKEFYLAKMARLNFERESGKLVEIEAVKRNFFNLARRTREAILNIPNRHAAELASETDSTRLHILLTRILTEALEELTDEQRRCHGDDP